MLQSITSQNVITTHSINIYSMKVQVISYSVKDRNTLDLVKEDVNQTEY